MAHIIDLKNRDRKSQPTNGQGSFEQNQAPATLQTTNYPRPTVDTVDGLGQLQTTRVISWSGQLYYQSNLKAAILAAVALFTIAALVQIFQKNIIATIFFALLGAVVLLNVNKKNGVGEFEINAAGIKIDERLHRYGELKSFWIEYDPALGIKELSLQTKKWYMPYVKIPIAEQNPVQLRLTLLEFLPEVEHKDTLVEILSRKLGI